ncbi:hypothetical protein [Pseudofrankia asymbiotica]|nr:hypothetical protein [Pseudofrankia asymbiotica]
MRHVAAASVRAGLLFERFPNLALTGEELQFRPSLTLRGFSRLTVSP